MTRRGGIQRHFGCPLSQCMNATYHIYGFSEGVGG